MRTAADRVADVRRLLAAAERVHQGRESLVPEIVRTTGLSPEGVELGFGCLERDASDEELRALVEGAGDAAHVHVVLSANVFVAPLRALAVARAAAERVTVRPSRRDPALARALVLAAGEDAMRIADERDVVAVDCTEIHVYGRDETVAAVRARARPGVRVCGYPGGLGLAVVTAAADVDRTAELLALDVVLFDQRGCLSPRVAIALGDGRRAERLAEALDIQLNDLGAHIPRGELLEDERAETSRWIETMRFAGGVESGPAHGVGLGVAGSPVSVPPAGRHLLVQPASTWEAAMEAMAPFARYVVTVGSDDVAEARRRAPDRWRVAELGRMQRPPLDGPVDRRAASPAHLR